MVYDSRCTCTRAPRRSEHATWCWSQEFPLQRQQVTCRELGVLFTPRQIVLRLQAVRTLQHRELGALRTPRVRTAALGHKAARKLQHLELGALLTQRVRTVTLGHQAALALQHRGLGAQLTPRTRTAARRHQAMQRVQRVVRGRTRVQPNRLTSSFPVAVVGGRSAHSGLG